MNQVTIEQVMQWKTCYSEKRVRECFAGRVSLSWKDIIALNIPTADKVSALLHEEFFTTQELLHLACDFAESVLHLANDPRCVAALRTKRCWIDGKATNEELDTALTAVEVVTRDAAHNAAGSSSGARIAARDACWNATRLAIKNTNKGIVVAKDVTWTFAHIGGLRNASCNTVWKPLLTKIVEVLQSKSKEE